jgi:50S ribosomal subunit-associated GTPase HflX
LVCDLTRPESFDHLPAYIGVIHQACPAAQLILAANKTDLVDQLRLSPSEIEVYAAGLQIPYYLTSAKSGDQVELLFRQLGQLMLNHQL